MHSTRQNNQRQNNQESRPAVVAVFAHPDDEAFGPSGTITKLSKTRDVYILCATRGEAGGNLENLGKVREKELLKSAKILGVKKVYFLGFKDGTLSNALYHKLVQKIEGKLNLLKPETLITFEPRGISGHIDHITVSMVTSYVFYRLPFVKKLFHYCITEETRRLIKDYFIYFPPGYKKAEIDKVVDVADVWETKVKAMMTHKSQIKDGQRILKMRQNLPKEEYFMVIKKT